MLPETGICDDDACLDTGGCRNGSIVAAGLILIKMLHSLSGTSFYSRQGKVEQTNGFLVETGWVYRQAGCKK